MKKKLHMYFNGSVQGVGFRFTVEHLARRFAIGGFVRNLYDGRVELVAEGEECELETFRDAILMGRLKSYINSHSEDWTEAGGEYPNFAIRF